MGDHIFICYARKDQSFVLRLAASLKARGVPVWLDQWNIQEGTDWDQSIDSALHDCTQFLIVLSPVAVASEEVRGELRTALNKKKPVVPVLRQACEMPRQLLLKQYVDFTGCGPDDVATLDRLVRALGMLEEGHLPQSPQRVRSDARRLWLHGTVGGLLVLGALLGWLWPRQPTKPDNLALAQPLLLSSARLSDHPTNSPSLPPSPRPLRTNEKEDKPSLIPVYISTQPSGFDVYREGQRVGTTPQQFDEPIGSYFKAVLKREGFKDEEINFRVNEYQNEYMYTPEKSSRR
jgi:TIR domain